MADFTPELQGYNKPGAFRFWCQKVLPLVYDDSLSYYELLNKVVDYLNHLIEDNQTTIENIGSLLASYNQLRGYVNDYFDNLDVQEEINTKLDDMAEDGSLSDLISAYLDPLIAAQNVRITAFENSVNDSLEEQTEFNNVTRGMLANTYTAPFPVGNQSEIPEGAHGIVWVEETGTDGSGFTWKKNYWYYTVKENGVLTFALEGGLYQASGVQTDKTLSVPDMAADAQVTGQRIDNLTADAQTAGQRIANLNTIMESGINLLNLSTLKNEVYIDSTNGREVQYNSWSASDYIPISPNTDYWMIIIGGSLVYACPAGTNFAFYDNAYNYLSGGITTANGAMTAPANAKYLRVSRATNSFTYAMVGKKAYLQIYTDKLLHTYDKVEYGDYPISNKLTIIEIKNPFVFYQWNNICYFRFDKIIYADFDGITKELAYHGQFDLMYNNLITPTNTSRVRNCCTLESGYTFIYSMSLRRFAIVESSNIANKDVIMLACDNGLMSGVLFDKYNAKQSYYTARQVYHNMPIDVINAVDSAFPSNVIGTANERFVFAYVTDNHAIGAHIGKEANLTAMAIDYTDKRITYDAIINCGDELLTSPSGGNALVALSNAVNSYNIDKLVFCEGNHDRGIIDPVIAHKQYYNTVLRHWRDNANVHAVYPKAYYYRDFPRHKIRVVCLNPYDMPDEKQNEYPYNDYYGYDQAQMVWLRDTALKIGSDWSVIVVDHTLPVTTQEGMIGNGTAGQNPLVLRQMLESFKNGTDVRLVHTDTVADGFFNIDMTTQFNAQGARTLIGVFGGHVHIDEIITINGINYVATCCGYIDSVEYSGNRGNRDGLTYSAVCFDIGTIDQINREVSLYRIGFIPTGGTAVRTFTY